LSNPLPPPSEPGSNPFATPYVTQAYNPGGGYPGGPAEDPFVKQVPVVGILTMVQGGLELLMGIFLIAMAFLMSVVMINDRGPGRPPDEVAWIVGGVYGLLGLGVFGLGSLRLYAGYCVFKFRRRILAIVTGCLGFATLITCYCAPTALGIGIYSLIVLLQPAVIAAFDQKKGA
jgi:hypothetical protein